MARKGGLGKGLDALIPGGENQSASGNASLIPVDNIIANPRQPRQDFQDEHLNELAASIREHGILQPLIVSYDPGSDTYTLIAGERRLRAARLIGLDVVPCVVRSVSDQQRLELALIENVQREDLNPLETAEAYHQLSDQFNLSHEEIAARVGKNRVTITNTLRLLKLPEVVRQALMESRISEGHARALLGFNSPQAQVAALQTILAQGLTVRQTEELVRKMSGEKPGAHLKPPTSPEVSAVEERLRTALGTKVTLRHGKKGGSLVIHYYSDEELESIISQITKE
jgi:ParB family transcriptional regulator, chromosome partitioning protein